MFTEMFTITHHEFVLMSFTDQVQMYFFVSCAKVQCHLCFNLHLLAFMNMFKVSYITTERFAIENVVFFYLKIVQSMETICHIWSVLEPEVFEPCMDVLQHTCAFVTHISISVWSR